MKPELEQKLIQRFPKYLGTLQNHGGFFNCESGWFVLLWMFFQEMETNGFEFKVAVVKEKFGSLRIQPTPEYYPFNDTGSLPLDNRVWDAFDVLACKSWETCEFCGKQGRIRWEYTWIRVLCDDCEFDYEEKSPKRRDPNSPDLTGWQVLPDSFKEQVTPKMPNAV